MSHPFGDLLSQHLHRKHGLSQAKLAEGILQEPSVITEMCKGRRLTGPQARERVVAILHWLHGQNALATEAEANALLSAAGLSPLHAGELRGINLSPAPFVLNGFVPHVPSNDSNNLPTQPTPFVGRAREVAEIVRRLEDPTCRLLTLLGPGGVGKSRLSLQAAQQLAPSAIPQGAHFVQLSPVASPDDMVAAIAQALQFNFYSEVPARQQLLDYLRAKQLLLILDNAEHLTAGAPFFSEMLAYAPRLKLLVTSREALNLQEEWLYVVEGMALPASDEMNAGASNAGASDALHLFVQCAQRVRADFGSERDLACARRICALVEGMPLGIELAASWLRTLPCEQIAREVERSLDILSSRMQNVPERHRSVRAVFEHSWQRLSAAEQDAFMRLSVLRGFWLEAAANVAGATLSILAALVDKSLLRVSATGRYQIHALLRQLVEEKLRADETVHRETLANHNLYYLGYVAQREEGLLGAAQVQALNEISEESDNIRTAWERAVQQGNWEAVASALSGLYWFYKIRSRFAEGEAVFTLAAQVLQPQQDVHRRLYSQVLARQGAFSASAGKHDAAKILLDEALSLARANNTLTEVAFVLNRQGNLLCRHVEAHASIVCLEQSLDISEQIQDECSIAQTLFELGVAYSCGLAAWDRAAVLLQRSLTINRKLQLQHQTAYVLEYLGTSMLLLGDNAAVEPYYRESLRMFRELDDWLGYAKALNGLGWSIANSNPPQLQSGIQHQAESIMLLRKLGHRRDLSIHLLTLSKLLIKAGQYDHARANITESLSISTELNGKIVTAEGYMDLGKIASRCKEFAQARQHIRQALLTLLNADSLPTIKWLLIIWVQIWADENDERQDMPDAERMQALALLYVCLKEQVESEILNDGEPLMKQLEAELPAERVAEAKARSTTLSVDEVVAEILQTENEQSPHTAETV